MKGRELTTKDIRLNTFQFRISSVSICMLFKTTGVSKRKEED